jgi:hypothetical protein
MPAATDDTEFSPEEVARFGPAIIVTLHVLHLALCAANISLAGWLVYAGWTGFSWWTALPGAAIAWLALRVLRTWALNIIDFIAKQLEAAAQSVDVEPDDHDGNETVELEPPAQSPQSAKKATPIQLAAGALAFLLIPAPLWYGVGSLMGMLL